MITGIRSIVFCDKVERDDRGVSYIGLHGEVMKATSCPGYVDAWMALLVEADKKASTGKIKVDAERYSEIFPFAVPAGVALTAMAFPLLIPVFDEGQLRIAVHNDAGGKPHRTIWRLGFTADAKMLDDSVAEDLIKLSTERGDALREGFARQAAPKH